MNTEHTLNIMMNIRLHLVALVNTPCKIRLKHHWYNSPLIWGNQCADFLAKLGASSDVDFLTQVSQPENVNDLLKNDAMRIFFLLVFFF
jgi:hypothetical protein